MLTKLFRDFKRHFDKCKNIVEKLGEFKFQLNFDGEKSVASNQIPDNKETMRFAILMRRFLAPTSNLYYKKVWSTISNDFPQEIPQVLKEMLKAGLRN